MVPDDGVVSEVLEERGLTEEELVGYGEGEITGDYAVGAGTYVGQVALAAEGVGEAVGPAAGVALEIVTPPIIPIVEWFGEKAGEIADVPRKIVWGTAVLVIGGALAVLTGMLLLKAGR